MKKISKNKFKKVTSFNGALNDHRVDSISCDYSTGEKSYWIFLKGGYVCVSMECHTIRESTIRQCLDMLNNDVISVDEFRKQHNPDFK